VTRAATIEEIKSTALALMRREHTIDVTFADIARDMGMTAPGLYRYFASRDDLLTALIADTYDDVAERLAAVTATVTGIDPGRRLIAVSQSYREWAVAFPERLALLFGLPLAGYQAPEDGPTTEAAERAMANFHAVVEEAQRAGTLRPPLMAVTGPAVPDTPTKGHGLKEIPPETVASMCNAWAALHGFVTLEAWGNFDWVEPGARDGLFVNHVRMVALMIGVPDPVDGWSLATPARPRAVQSV